MKICASQTSAGTRTPGAVPAAAQACQPAPRHGEMAGRGGAHGLAWAGRAIENRKSKIANAFTIIEIAICLAIIGIALIAIIGVLPLGINVQKDNRQETLVDQDATVFLNALRNGARGLDNLTNYVYAISNSWASFNDKGVETGHGSNFYTYTDLIVTTPAGYPVVGSFLTNGANIIGLLSAPEYTDDSGVPIPSLVYGGYSNHVVAFVRSLSGPAVNQPPQTNATVLAGSFGYEIICHNAPAVVETNLFYDYPYWDGGGYIAPAHVSYVVNRQMTFWYATQNTSGADVPGESLLWMPDPEHGLELAANLHQLRLTFLWPVLPNGHIGNGRHTFATTVAGQLTETNIEVNANPAYRLYFLQPQSFTSVP